MYATSSPHRGHHETKRLPTLSTLSSPDASSPSKPLLALPQELATLDFDGFVQSSPTARPHTELSVSL